MDLKKKEEEKEKKEKKILSHGGNYNKLENVFNAELRPLGLHCTRLMFTLMRVQKDSCNFKCDGNINQKKKNIK